MAFHVLDRSVVCFDAEGVPRSWKAGVSIVCQSVHVLGSADGGLGISSLVTPWRCPLSRAAFVFHDMARIGNFALLR